MTQGRGEAAEHFERRWGRPPTHVVWSPGRVNLIGEHTDYSHLPVLPMAIDRGLWIAVGPAEEKIEAVSAAFPEAVDWSVHEVRAHSVDRLPPWHRYVLGAVRALQASAGEGFAGARMAIVSDLPSVGGLSSSSALTLGLLQALDAVTGGHDSSRQRLVRLATEAERTVGVESGGMDQNVIAFAERGRALRIDFAPTRFRTVPLPEGWSWIAASSGLEAPKGGRVRDHYNARVLGTRLAAALLGRELGRDPNERLAAYDDDEGRAAVAALPVDAGAASVAQSAGVDLGRLLASSAGGLRDPGAVPVRAVADHVLSEAARVDQAERALERSDLQQVGALLDASHASLQRFGASTAELDRLCEAMRGAGAAGARLTGAGFGGFAIAVAPAEQATAAVDAAIAACGGPAFTVAPSPGLRLL